MQAKQKRAESRTEQNRTGQKWNIFFHTSKAAHASHRVTEKS